MRIFAAVLTSVLLLSGTATAAPAPTWSPSPVEWGSCGEDFPDGECGTVTVPLDWHRPSGATMDLAVARHRATDPARRLGVLMVNPGGPGTSAAEFALFSGYFSQEILARFDIVGFDERGTQSSQIIKCPEQVDAPSTYPATEAEFNALLSYNRKAVADCRAANLPVFDHADTASAAQDMDAVRRALGERKISYHGISYGTLLGQQYAESFGSHIRAMVLDSNIDHSVDIDHFLGDRATSVEDSFLRFVHWCDTTETCALHGQDVLATWQTALRKADQQPLGPNWLREWVLADLRGPDYDDIGRIIAATAAGLPTMTTQLDYNYASLRLAVVCQDFSLRISDFAQYSRLRAIELRKAPLMGGTSLSHDEAVACMGVTGPPANPPHRLDVDNAPKILLLNSLDDPSTPYAWARRIHAQAPNTALLTYEGAGHGVYDNSTCARAATDAYLLTLKARDTTCPDQPH
ncbi:alpha/beta hydrolase [Actinophytocola oryzae]|uniref:Alpha/beta hydrolase family protein n=1 Tax=Actinophytocola oryzae TaxID=502181 RepID=A0A4R7V0P1_9PSEU|nr:alpha/beta hydrolase [Actinophytocola oryzae]TDV40966.1 alpha/beta hydrolase family protein [Actinophytocola oryzae]